jgi:hypothetical protein
MVQQAQPSTPGYNDPYDDFRSLPVTDLPRFPQRPGRDTVPDPTHG